MNKILPNQTVNMEEGSEGTEGLSRRELLMWVVASAVFGVSSLWREALADEVKEVKVAENLVSWPQVAAATVNDANKDIITGSITPQWSSFDEINVKYGGYEWIVIKYLGTSDPKIIAFIRREGDLYLSKFSWDEKVKQSKGFAGALIWILSKAKWDEMPTNFSVNFISSNLPQILIEFAKYDREYPNLASKWQLLLSEQKLRQSQQELEAARKLNKVLGWKG